MPDSYSDGIVSSLTHWVIGLKDNPHLLFLFLVLMLGFIFTVKYKRKILTPEIMLSLISLGVMIIHLNFAKTNWFFRYEAYICVMGTTAITLIVHNAFSKIVWNYRKKVVVFLLICTLLVAGTPMFHRAIQSIAITPASSRNIYEQAYQMGEFLRTYYKGENVVVHDIGAVSYLSDVNVIDFLGLATIDLTRVLKNDRRLNTSVVNAVIDSKNARIGIVYEPWFGHLLTGEWRKVCQWQISGEAITCGEPIVTFYARGDKAAKKLRASLLDFKIKLPYGVSTRFF